MQYTNDFGISLPLQAWLVHDDYDGYSPEPKTISVTTLLKPLRQIILNSRVDYKALTVDLMDLVALRSGSAFHDSIEYVWKNHYKSALAKLGYHQKEIDAILINPTPEELAAHPNPIPIYMEQRAFKEINGWTISGKFDFLFDNTVTDFKSTSTYKWQKNASDNDYKMQGSLYRWLNPDKILHNHINIEFIFTDFSKLKAMTDANKGYPPRRLMQKAVPLMEVKATEQWIINKIGVLDKLWNAPQSQLPECSQEELWQDPPEYKYFKNPSATRATKVFGTDKLAAYQYKADAGGIGEVKEIPSKAKACNYCNARGICDQYAALKSKGLV